MGSALGHYRKQPEREGPLTRGPFFVFGAAAPHAAWRPIGIDLNHGFVIIAPQQSPPTCGTLRTGLSE